MIPALIIGVIGVLSFIVMGEEADTHFAFLVGTLIFIGATLELLMR